MNLKTSRITTESGSGAILNHVLAGRDNERIVIISGSRDDAECAFGDATNAGKKYGLRHIAISSKEELTPKQRDQIIKKICGEINITADDIVLRVRHTKNRFDNSGDRQHEHILIREYNPITKRVLDATWFQKNNEKLAREIEIDFGLGITKGKHNKRAVLKLQQEGKLDIAAALVASGITDGPPAISSYTSTTHQQAKCHGLHMPTLKNAVIKAFRSDNPLKNLPANILVTRGNKKWIAHGIADDGTKVLIGSVDRIIKSEDAIVGKMLLTKPKDIKNVRPFRSEAPIILRDVPTVQQFCDFSAQRLSKQNVLRDNALDSAQRREHRGDNALLSVRTERAVARAERLAVAPVPAKAEAPPLVPAKAAAAPRPQASPVSQTRQPAATSGGKSVPVRQSNKAGRQKIAGGHGGDGGGSISVGGKSIRPWSGDPSDLRRFFEECLAAITLRAGSSPPAPPPGLAPEIRLFAVSHG